MTLDWVFFFSQIERESERERGCEEGDGVGRDRGRQRRERGMTTHAWWWREIRRDEGQRRRERGATILYRGEGERYVLWGGDSGGGAVKRGEGERSKRACEGEEGRKKEAKWFCAAVRERGGEEEGGLRIFFGAVMRERECEFVRKWVYIVYN